MNTLILTSIYQPFWGTEEFMKSTKHLGLPVHNVWKTPGNFTGHGDTYRYYYEGILHAKDIGYDSVIFADGADSIFLKKFDPPINEIIVSTEKAIWPPTPRMKKAWEDYYSREWNKTDSPWKYLNAGGWCGPVDLLIKFYEYYGLHKYKGDINGQGEFATAFLQAKAEDFPIELDVNCKYFQTTGFEDPNDFDYDETCFINLITKSEPCVLHGNGRTDMKHLYKLYNK